MNIRDVAGVSTPAELYEVASVQYGLHTDSIDKLVRFVVDMQRRALADRDAREAALDRMVANAEELGLYDDEQPRQFSSGCSSCSHCDYGKFPCNQNCIVAGD